jgi:hypothetical protein
MREGKEIKIAFGLNPRIEALANDKKKKKDLKNKRGDRQKHIQVTHPKEAMTTITTGIQLREK